MALCDTMLRLAERDLYSPRWSAEIIEEARRNLVADGRCTEAAAANRFRVIGEHFEECTVHGYEELTASLRCHQKDRHVLAAAIRGGAEQIVTQNLRDFPPDSVEPFAIEVVSPDDFLLNIADLYPDVTLDAIRRQAAALQRPPMTIDDVLRALSMTVPGFAAHIAAMIAAVGAEPDARN